MNLVSLAISILWFAIGVIIIVGVVWVALWGIRQVTPIPAPIEKLIWAVVVILVLIAVLSLLAGGGGSFGHFRFGASQSYATIAANPSRTAFHL